MTRFIIIFAGCLPLLQGCPAPPDLAPGASAAAVDLDTAGDPEAICPSAAFLDVDGVQVAGDGHPATALSVRCEGGTMYVESNGVPNYPFVQTTPNALAAQDHRWAVALDPLIGDPVDIPRLGEVGFAINGLPFYGPNEGPMPDPFGDPVANAILDSCLGHTAQRGDYHHHALLQACLRPDVAADAASPILGFALDGVPIHGPRGCLDADCEQVVTFESGYEQVNAGALDCGNDAACASDEVCALSMIDGAERMACVPKTQAWDNHQYVARGGSTVLDACNGRMGPDGVYRYHATDTFPYIVGCYRGQGR